MYIFKKNRSWSDMVVVFSISLTKEPSFACATSAELAEVPRSAALTSSARIDALGRSVMELLRGKLDDLAG